MNDRKQKIAETKQPSKISFLGCIGSILLILLGIFLLGFFFVGPTFVKEFLFSNEETIIFSSKDNVALVVMIFIVLWFFACLYFVKRGKHFLILMTVPFAAWIMLFFNYSLVTLDGVKISPYFHVIPKFTKWEEMEEVAIIPSYFVVRGGSEFQIKVACLINGKTHFIESNGDLKKLQKLKKRLANQGNVPVFIYPLDKGDINRLSEYKEDHKEYYKAVLKFLEIKDINNYKKEHILVNESFYE